MTNESKASEATAPQSTSEGSNGGQRAIIVPGSQFGSGDRVYDLIAEDGEHLASHVCSAPGFAPYDLYLDRPERKEMFDAKGITGWAWIDGSGIALDELLRRNKEWHASESAVAS